MREPALLPVTWGYQCGGVVRSGNARIVTLVMKSAQRRYGWWIFLLLAPVSVFAGTALELGSRRELFVDDFLIAQKSGLELRLHAPVPREVVMVRDRPWEGTGTDFETVFRDGDVIRMYYMACKLTTDDGAKLTKPIVAHACYAESRDGLVWTRPSLGLFGYEGSKENNILWEEPGLDNFTPFKDANPDCPPDERYKALVGLGKRGLFVMKSADGIHWSRRSDQPIIPGDKGAFDTMNVAFWDAQRRLYYCYFRGFHDSAGKDFIEATKGIRDIRVSTSRDFRTWSEPHKLQYQSPDDDALYTNQVEPYYRAPHLFVGFPMRYVDRIDSRVSLDALPNPGHRRRRMVFSPRYGSVITDGLFMSSRDGLAFNRWDEAFIRPGPERGNNWVYGDALKGRGLIETPASDPTAPPELSLYVTEGHWIDEAEPLRRYTLRVDGFVSLHAPRAPGEFVSKPLTFTGARLSLNFATSAAGTLRIELQDEAGRPLPGFALADADRLFGDTLDRAASWGGRTDVSAFAGKVVRLRVVMSDADLYSLQFQP